MARPKAVVPAYLFHKATGQARCRINGRDHYLGRYGSPESRKAYGKLVAKIGNGTPIDPFVQSRRTTTSPEVDPGPSVAEVCLAFTRHAEKHYRKNGKITSEVWAFRSLIDILTDLFGMTSAAEFGPACLKTCRARMIELGWCRSSVNRGVSRIRRIFSFAVEDELVSPTILAGMKAVSPLLSGRTEARDADPIKPVADATVDATLPHLTPIVADMVRVQRLTGMRPGEVCRMLWQEIDTTGPVWLFQPADHKLAHKNIARVVAIGPAAQEILLKRRQLVGPVFPGRGGAFTPAAYRRAIARGCDVAFDMPDGLSKEKAEAWRAKYAWAPNQLRHAFGTAVRKTYGLDAVAAALGHREISTSQVYAELDTALAADVAAKCG